MTPGIPGAGIGGLFYLGASVVLALRHAGDRLLRRQARFATRDVALLTALALGIVAGIWLMGWLLGALLSQEVRQLRSAGVTALLAGTRHSENVVRVAAVIAGIGTLAAVMAGVELARLRHGWRRGRTSADSSARTNDAVCSLDATR
ncbi:MAG: hypothetical protein ACT4R6_07140 [Gemmatimonadaceae bacterium]